MRTHSRRKQFHGNAAIGLDAEGQDIFIEIKLRIVDWRAALAAYAQEKITALCLLQEKGHVLASHGRLGNKDAILTHHLGGTCSD